MPACPACGHENPDGASFCNARAAPLQVAERFRAESFYARAGASALLATEPLRAATES